MPQNQNVARIISLRTTQRETVFGKEYLNIGPTPHDEACTEAGQNSKDSILECQVYIGLLKRCKGEPPNGCEFFIMRNDHECGCYYDVNIFYKISDEEESANECEDYALNVENGIDTWDEVSLQELRDGNHHLYTGKVISMKKTA